VEGSGEFSEKWDGHPQKTDHIFLKKDKNHLKTTINRTPVRLFYYKYYNSKEIVDNHGNQVVGSGGMW